LGICRKYGRHGNKTVKREFYEECLWKEEKMKNKFLYYILNILVIANIIGCGSVTPENSHVGEKEEIASVQEETSLNIEESPDDSTEESSMADAQKGDASNEEMSKKEKVATEPDFGFEDLSKRQFIFASGAGGWEEDFTIEKDGYFTGKYYDSDMGSVGEGYPDGTVYGCTYSGYFTDLTKINDYTYTMKLSEITYKESGDTEEIKDNVRYIYTASCCLGGSDTFTIYLPGAPLSEFSEEVCRWLFVDQERESELSMIAIVDEANEYGIYSQERPAPLEDARMMLDTCKKSYDYYGEKLSEAMTTLEMVEYTGRMYEISDECLNYIWNLIRYNVDEDKYEEILAEQREWIDEKEARGEEVLQEYGEGSFAAVDYNDIMANVTMERCEELIAYLE